MDMDMEFVRKLPTPKELKEQHPVSKEIQALKESRDETIRNIMEGKDNRLLLVIGPCSADHEDPVIEYISRLAKVQEQVAASVESMTGLKVKVNVHVTGISFDKTDMKG